MFRLRRVTLCLAGCFRPTPLPSRLNRVIIGFLFWRKKGLSWISGIINRYLMGLTAFPTGFFFLKGLFRILGIAWILCLSDWFFFLWKIPMNYLTTFFSASLDIFIGLTLSVGNDFNIQFSIFNIQFSIFYFGHYQMAIFQIVSFAIAVALRELPNFVADPHDPRNGPAPHHQCTIHLNCENSEMLEKAYQQGKAGLIPDRSIIDGHIESQFVKNPAGKGSRKRRSLQLGVVRFLRNGWTRLIRFNFSTGRWLRWRSLPV